MDETVLLTVTAASTTNLDGFKARKRLWKPTLWKPQRWARRLLWWPSCFRWTMLVLYSDERSQVNMYERPGSKISCTKTLSGPISKSIGPIRDVLWRFIYCLWTPPPPRDDGRVWGRVGRRKSRIALLVTHSVRIGRSYSRIFWDYQQMWKKRGILGFQNFPSPNPKKTPFRWN